MSSFTVRSSTCSARRPSGAPAGSSALHRVHRRGHGQPRGEAGRGRFVALRRAEGLAPVGERRAASLDLALDLHLVSPSSPGLFEQVLGRVCGLLALRRAEGLAAVREHCAASLDLALDLHLVSPSSPGLFGQVFGIGSVEARPAFSFSPGGLSLAPLDEGLATVVEYGAASLDFGLDLHLTHSS